MGLREGSRRGKKRASLGSSVFHFVSKKLHRDRRQDDGNLVWLTPSVR